jgi:antirestriction protein ArdC
MSFDIYQTITDKIIAQLETRVMPWLKPWADKERKGTIAIYPFNGATGRNYNGLNLLLLGCSNYDSNAWYSYKQVKDLGGNVRKGEKSTMVTFWSITEKQNTETGKIEKSFFLKYYNVFNYEQCDNLPMPKQVAIEPITYTSLDSIVKQCGIGLNHGGNRAYYSPSADAITMPIHSAFIEYNKYDGVLAHELTHATGHTSRLNRDFSGRFGSDAYAFEELIAELGSAFLCASLGIVPELQHNASYIASWLKVLKDDKKAIITASSQAQKACNFVLDIIGQGVLETESQEAA